MSVERFSQHLRKRELEVAGVELTIRTGPRPEDEVLEVYANEDDAARAADLLRQSWTEAGWKSEQGPTLFLGSAPARGGGVLVDRSGKPLSAPRRAPMPVRRVSRDPLAADPRLRALVDAGAIRVTLEAGAVVAAQASVSDPLGGRSTPLRTLLASRMAKKSLRTLEVCLSEEGELETACALVGTGLPSTLETLTLASFEGTPLFLAERGKFAPALPGLGSVRCLELQAGSVALGALALPELRELSVRAAGLSREALAAVLSASWPRLESLTLWFGSRRHGATWSVADLGPLLSGESFPSLRRLSLLACEPADEVAARLASAPLLARLRKLDLSYGLLTDAGVDALEAAKPGATLETLGLRDTAVSGAGKARARGLAREVVLEPAHSLGANDSVDHFVPIYAGGELIYLENTG